MFKILVMEILSGPNTEERNKSKLYKDHYIKMYYFYKAQKQHE